MTSANRDKDHPLEAKTTGTVTLANWQQHRAYGLRNLERVVPDLISANAEEIRPLRVERDYAIGELAAVRALRDHDACDGLLVLSGDRIAYEGYANGMTPTSLHSCQSSTKTTMNLLAGKAIAGGALDLDAPVEQYVPEIGDGFRGRSVDDVLAMNVRHELDEMAAMTGDRTLFDKEESSMGLVPSSITPMNRREFIASLGPGNEDGTNENRTGGAFYATINTALAGWLVERATGESLQQSVRELMHAIGGENPIYMAVDRVGVPLVGAGFVMTLRDFARYGMLLGSGGAGVGGELVGGGPGFVQRTLADGVVPYDVEGYYYVYSAFASEYGFGHAGWGGQWIWADPASETVIAAFAGLMGADPADHRYLELLVEVTGEVVDYARQASSES